MNWSNGAVASSRHCPSALNCARADCGNEQYGCLSHSPRLSSPKIECEYQKNPKSVVTRIAASEISSRVRSSVRWSTSDIVASGLVRLRLLRGLSRFRKPAVRAEALKRFTTLGQWLSGSAATRLGERTRFVMALLGGRRRVDPLRLHGLRGVDGRRSLGLAFGLHFTELGLENAHRLAQRARRIGELLRTEQQDHHDGDDRHMSRGKKVHGDYLPDVNPMLPQRSRPPGARRGVVDLTGNRDLTLEPRPGKTPGPPPRHLVHAVRATPVQAPARPTRIPAPGASSSPPRHRS